MKRSGKYNAQPTVVDGIKFDSKREARRWSDLILLARAGTISGLARQKVYELAPSVRLYGEKRAKPALRYVADFIYWENFQFVVEDAKGRETPVSRIKRHLMKSVHNIDVRLI